MNIARGLSKACYSQKGHPVHGVLRFLKAAIKRSDLT